MPFLTSASGEGAVAVNYLVESLTSWVALGFRTVAPAHWLQPGRLAGQQRFPSGVLHRLMGAATFSFGWYQFFPMSLEDRSAEFSFAGVDAGASQEEVDILIHKGNLIASAIQGLMGRDKVIEFLALLRQRHGGGTFGLGDFIAAMAETDPAMAPYIEHLMRESSLPGFLVSGPSRGSPAGPREWPAALSGLRARPKRRSGTGGSGDPVQGAADRERGGPVRPCAW